MVTNNVTVYQFEVGLDEVFADEVRFRVNIDSSLSMLVFASMDLALVRFTLTKGAGVPDNYVL